MLRFIKNHWGIILAVILLGIVYYLDSSKFLTWINVDSDGPEYVMDARFFFPAHHTSAPLFLLLGHVFLWIPFGSEYWRMSLMSAIFTLGAAIFIYLIVRQLVQKHARFYGILASVIFGGAALVIAQATIVETYSVVTFFSVAAYYFVIKKKWYWASAMIGAGILTHHLMFLTYIVLFVFHKELRPFKFKPFKIQNVKPFLITCSFLILYAYMPLSIRFTDQPNMWGNTTFLDFFKNNIAVFNMLVGQLPIYELPKRILETFGVLGISLGLATIPVIWFLIKQKTWKSEWLFLFGLPVLYFCTDLAPQVSKYAEASIAWGPIIAVIALSKVNWKWTIPIVLSAITLLSYNSWYFNVGGHLDKNYAAQQFYDYEIPKMQDGDIFVTMAAWEWIEVYLYNKEEGHSINPICIGVLASEKYQDLLREKGIKISSLMTDVQPGSDSHDLNEKQVAVAMSIVELNDHVWTSRSTQPEVYGAEIVPAKGNEHLITMWVGQKDVVPQWKWKPMNPWRIIDGSREITDWTFIMQSTYSCMFFAEFATFGLFLNYLINRLFFNKRKEEKQLVAIDK